MCAIKYLLFRGYGNRLHRRNEIRHIIRNLHLGMEVESLKFEGGQGNLFYFGIGINVENPLDRQPSVTVRRLIDAIGQQPIPNRNLFFFDSNEITRGFLRDNYEYDSFLEPIRFIPGVPFNDNGFDGYDLADTDMNGLDDSLAMNRLLWWCSAKGEGSIQIFNEVADLLCPDSNAGSIMRKLRLLGYVELDQDGRRWWVVPTTIVHTTDAGSYLAGKVAPAMFCSLPEYATSTTNGGPMRIGVDAWGESCGIPVVSDPALTMADLLPEADTWRSGLRGEPDIEPHRYTLRLYDGCTFNEYAEYDPVPGFYEVQRREGIQRTKRVVFDGQRWFSGAFYDLRWLAKKIAGANMMVRLDEHGTLFVPEAERWPLLYEHPLVLASGTLPVAGTIGKQRALAYTSVGTEVAKVLTGKLGIELTEE